MHKKPNFDIKILKCPVASGASVMADRDKFNEILGQNRKLMELKWRAMEYYVQQIPSRSLSQLHLA